MADEGASSPAADQQQKQEEIEDIKDHETTEETTSRESASNKRPLDDNNEKGEETDPLNNQNNQNEESDNVPEKKAKQNNEEASTEPTTNVKQQNEMEGETSQQTIKDTAKPTAAAKEKETDEVTTKKVDSPNSSRPWGFKTALSNAYYSFFKSGSAKDKNYWKGLSLEEKRKKYKCGDRFLELKDIPTWPQFYNNQKVVAERRKGESDYTPNPILNNKISLWRGDITWLEIDAIVNAANSSLMGGGGVDGAIHSAAGPSLRDECYELNGCETGYAKTSTGHRLPAKFIIHTVGPMNEDSKQLKMCYKNCLKEVLEKECKSVAFCCIATGVYGFPNYEAANIALRTCREWLEKNHEQVDRIIFTVFLKKDYEIYSSLLPIYFPLDDSEISSSTGSGSDDRTQHRLTPHNIIPSLQKQPSEPIGRYRSDFFTQQDTKTDTGTHETAHNNSTNITNRKEDNTTTTTAENTPVSSNQEQESSAHAANEPTHSTNEPTHSTNEPTHSTNDTTTTTEESTSQEETTNTTKDPVTGELIKDN